MPPHPRARLEFRSATKTWVLRDGRACSCGFLWLLAACLLTLQPFSPLLDAHQYFWLVVFCIYAALEGSSVLLVRFGLGDPITGRWLQELNPTMFERFLLATVRTI